MSAVIAMQDCCTVHVLEAGGGEGVIAGENCDLLSEDDGIRDTPSTFDIFVQYLRIRFLVRLLLTGELNYSKGALLSG